MALPAVPVAFRHAVFDRDDRVLPDPVLVERDHLVGRAGLLAGLLEFVGLRRLVPELARRDVEREEHVVARLVAGLRDRFEHQVDRLAVGRQARREAAFVADPGGMPLLLQDAAQRVEDLGAGAKRLGERRGADRHHHELLEVDAAVGVRAAVEDVHHRHRQHGAAVRAAVQAGRCR